MEPQPQLGIFQTSVPNRRPDCSLSSVVYGIPEYKKGTLRHMRLSNDYSALTDIFATLDSNFGDYSIRNYYRLSRFSTEACLPHPILVSFNRASDVFNILHKRSSLPQSIIIRPDMSPKQRSQEALLLKQRWLLIQSGTPRKKH